MRTCLIVAASSATVSTRQSSMNGQLTISSLHIGHTSLVLVDLDLDGPPTLMLDARSSASSGSGRDGGGEADDESIDKVLSEGAKGLAARWT